MSQRERIAAALKDVKTLPTLPDVAMRLLESSNNPDVSTREVAGTVESDMALASRLLKLVNSPFFGVRREVTSVQQALMIIGMSNLRSLVLSTAVMDLFDRQGSVGNFDRGAFWTHCVAVAAAARAIARKTRVVDPDVAFTAGLLHDMGKVVVDRYLHEEFQQIADMLVDETMTMTAAEQEVLDVNHAELGQYLAVHWNLPKALQSAVGFHHSPADAPEHGSLAALVYAADAMARKLRIGSGGGADHDLDSAVLVMCKLSEEQFETLALDLADGLEEQINELAQNE